MNFWFDTDVWIDYPTSYIHSKEQIDLLINGYFRINGVSPADVAPIVHNYYVIPTPSVHTTDSDESPYVVFEQPALMFTRQPIDVSKSYIATLRLPQKELKRLQKQNLLAIEVRKGTDPVSTKIELNFGIVSIKILPAIASNINKKSKYPCENILSRLVTKSFKTEKHCVIDKNDPLWKKYGFISNENDNNYNNKTTKDSKKQSEKMKNANSDHGENMKHNHDHVQVAPEIHGNNSNSIFKTYNTKIQKHIHMNNNPIGFGHDSSVTIDTEITCDPSHEWQVLIDNAKWSDDDINIMFKNPLISMIIVSCEQLQTYFKNFKSKTSTDEKTNDKDFKFANIFNNEIKANEHGHIVLICEKDNEAITPDEALYLINVSLNLCSSNNGNKNIQMDLHTDKATIRLLAMTFVQQNSQTIEKETTGGTKDQMKCENKDQCNFNFLYFKIESELYRDPPIVPKRDLWWQKVIFSIQADEVQLF